MPYMPIQIPDTTFPALSSFISGLPEIYFKTQYTDRINFEINWKIPPKIFPMTLYNPEPIPLTNSSGPYLIPS
jgi:hypothetical protein